MTTYPVTRAMWGADPLAVQLGAAIDPDAFVGLVLHHTVTDWVPSASVDDVAAHMRYLQRVRPDLGLEVPYSFVVLEHPDPQHAWLATGRGQGRSGAHTIGYNSTRYGVALAGDYSARAMTPGMIEAVRHVGEWYLTDPWGAEPTLAHRQVYATACPGNDAMAQLPTVQSPFAHLEPDMPLTTEDVTAVTAAVLNHPINLRKYREDLQTFTEEPSTIQGGVIFGHAEAAQAHILAGAALAAATAAITAQNGVSQQLAKLMETMNTVAIQQAQLLGTMGQVLSAVQAGGGGGVDVPTLTVAIVGAIRSVIAPLVKP